jgi:arylsulfatase A-like enzyme
MNRFSTSANESMKSNCLPLVAVALALLAPFAGAAVDRPNVLFIVADDLNDWAGPFGGNPQAKTPQLDRFARNGAVVFQRSYCPGPVCCPSRSALLSGFSPQTTGVYGNLDNMRRAPLVQAHSTLPEYFSRHGYRTISSGKIFHKHLTEAGTDEGQWAFDEWERESGDGRVDPQHKYSRGEGIIAGKVDPLSEYREGEGAEFAWGPTLAGKDATKDFRTARWAERQLARAHDRPFFLAVGFERPHLPWYVPQEYFDRHPLAEVKVPEFRLDDLDDITTPSGQPKVKSSADFKWVRSRPDLHARAVQAYLAAISYVDDCFGLVLDALERSAYRDNTIVVIWGDHGWHLGEKLRFRKATLWEESTRQPLMIRVPGMRSRQDCPRVVNLQDLYPTLVDLCGLPAKPAGALEGRSLAPLLRAPSTPWPFPTLTVTEAGSASVRDERWALIRYRDGTEEFYDMERDPMQWANLARSTDSDIRAAKQKLAQSFPANFTRADLRTPAGMLGKDARKGAKPDPSIRATREQARQN